MDINLITILLPLLPIAGIIIGALLQFSLSRKNKDYESFSNLKYEAYKDYLKAVSIIARSQSEAEIATVHSKLADAKARIAIFGSKEVIQNIAELERVGAVLIKPEALDIFEKIVKEMRNSKIKVSDKDIRILLFGDDN